MSFKVDLPPSLVAKLSKDDGGDEVRENESKQKRREDYKKMKELEELRKAGSVPALKDEEGRDINPHIPHYIMQAPWYHGALQPTLKHQRAPKRQAEPSLFESQQEAARKGVITSQPTATKFRKGACENCGALTHTKRDCLERPRRINAKWSNSTFAPDEHVPQSSGSSFDAKRDRWVGYQTEEYRSVIEDYERREDARKQWRAKRLEEKAKRREESAGNDSDAHSETKSNSEKDGAEPSESIADSGPGPSISIGPKGNPERHDADDDASSSDEEEEDEKYAERVAMPGQKFDTKQRQTVRNLRIREDTAKYLYNLDVDSAYYDPKTRSMRDNPFKEKKDSNSVPFAGDNFVRYSGDALKIMERQVFSWEMYEKGAEAHLQAEPTKLELLSREHGHKKEELLQEKRRKLLQVYGGDEHLKAPPKELLLAQTEAYVEYTRDGSLKPEFLNNTGIPSTQRNEGELQAVRSQLVDYDDDDDSDEETSRSKDKRDNSDEEQT